MYASRETVSLTTDADGAATGYSPVVTGRILALVYVKPASVSFSDGVDFTVTLEGTAEPIYTGTNVNASTVVYPRVGVHDATGAAATTDGTRLLREPVFAALDRVKIVVASGGDTKNGSFLVVVG